MEQNLDSSAKSANPPEPREEIPGVPTFPHGPTRSEVNVQPLTDSTQLWVDPFRGLSSAVGRNITGTLLIFLVEGRNFRITGVCVLSPFSNYTSVKISSFLECPV